MKRTQGAARRAKKIKFRPSLFWDADPDTIDPEKHAFYIIERILDFGTDEEVRWMWQRYPSRFIRDVIRRSRGIRPETKPLWHALTTAQRG